MDMRIGTWNVRNLYRARSLKTVATELAKYGLDLVALQEVRWDSGGSEPGHYTFFYGNRNANQHLGADFSYIKGSDQLLED
jgi:exonuclease III